MEVWPPVGLPWVWAVGEQELAEGHPLPARGASVPKASVILQALPVPSATSMAQGRLSASLSIFKKNPTLLFKKKKKLYSKIC